MTSSISGSSYAQLSNSRDSLCREAQDAEEGIRSATLKPPDLIILDLGLPDRDGATIIERLRAWSKTPIIVLTVRSNEREKVRLLELGADDYVVKPFGIGELVARAHAMLRPRVATTSANDPVVRVGPLEINLATRSGTIDGKHLVLGPKEYLVLQILAQHAARWSRVSRSCSRFGVVCTSMTRITCASSSANCAKRLRSIQTGHAFS